MKSFFLVALALVLGFCLTLACNGVETSTPPLCRESARSLSPRGERDTIECNHADHKIVLKEITDKGFVVRLVVICSCDSVVTP